MRSKPTDKIEDARTHGPDGAMAGFFQVKRGNAHLRIQVSNGYGWEHVSVSLATRTPTWEEMCWVKDQFFDEHEVVMQLHPAKAEYVNYHPYCLHLWRPMTPFEILDQQKEWLKSGEEYPMPATWPEPIPTPPPTLVGPKAKEKSDVSSR